MNQKGEVTLLSILGLIVITSLLTLSALKLHHSYQLLQKRTKLILCAKETKEELNRYMVFMGRTNWGIKNLLKVSLILVFIPGMQGAAASAPKMRKMLMKIQDLSLIAYMNKMRELKAKGCSIDPRLYITPFEIGLTGFKRDLLSAARLRSSQWDYHFLSKPYLLTLSIDARGYESVWPRINFHSSEKGEKLSFLSSSAY